VSKIFPQSFAEVLGLIDPDAAALLRASEAKIFREFGTVRDANLAARFVQETLSAGRLAIYGAGTQAAAIVAALKERHDIEVVGFVDRRHESLEEFCGYPVVGPSEARSLNFDTLLLSHHGREQEMFLSAVEAGVRPTQIRRIYADPDFGRWAAAAGADGDEPAMPVDVCIISTLGPQWTVVPHHTLANVFSPETSVNLLFGRFDTPIYSFAGDVFRYVDCRFSLDILIDNLRRLQPSVVYLKTSPHSTGEFLPFIVKSILPDCVLINEMYDVASLMQSSRLKQSYGYSDQEIYWARLGNLFSAQHADLIVCKNGGLGWDRLAASFAAPCVTVFPIGGEPPQQAYRPPSSRQCRVLFAGSIPPIELVNGRTTHGDLNYLDYFDVLETVPDVSVDMFNGGHVVGGDAFFQDYAARYPLHNSVRYHPRAAAADLIEKMPDYEFGWLCCHKDDECDVEPISSVVIGNKLTTYVDGGLPIVIDRNYVFMTELVERFGAGLACSWGERHEIGSRMLEADGEAMRAGVLRLRQHMRNENLRSLEAIRALAKRDLTYGTGK
jgi:hypothetical protein